MSADLLLRADALPGLLDGWVGPVLRHTPATIERPRLATIIGRTESAHLFYESMVGVYGVPFGWVETVFLDLSRAECRDRAKRVVGARLFGVEPTELDPEWFSDEHGWTMIAGDTGGNPETTLMCWDGAGQPYGAARFAVPALATLDPMSNDRLPDRSRTVLALGLAAVARAVPRVSP